MFEKNIFILCAIILHYSDCGVINDNTFTNRTDFNDIIGDQFGLSHKSPNSSVDLAFKVIFPGTKWCGTGNAADNYDDLGSAVEVDKCCRAHDNCQEGAIDPGETKYNLTNTAFHSRLSCRCDEIFRSCLRKDNSDTATTVGLIYFNVIGTQCYRKDYKVTGCARYSGWVNNKCIQYEYDKNSEQQYQWFDVPNYLKENN